MDHDDMWTTDPAPAAPSTEAVSAETTCTDCGGPLEPGRYARCRGCTDEEWLVIAQEMGVDWVAQHRADQEDRR